MRDFFDVNGKAIGKLYINQIAMSVFGIMVIFASAPKNLEDSPVLMILASFLAVGLYLFIIYSMMWDQGATAAAKTLRAEDAGIRKIQTPFLIVLFGSLFNILCYMIYNILQIYVTLSKITDGKAASFGNLIWHFMRMINAIYMGFESLLFPNPYIESGIENAVLIMHTPAYYFFLTLVPLFLVGILAYYMGASEISILRKLGFNIKTRKVSNTHINYSKNKK